MSAGSGSFSEARSAGPISSVSGARRSSQLPSGNAVRVPRRPAHTTGTPVAAASTKAPEWKRSKPGSRLYLPSGNRIRLSPRRSAPFISSILALGGEPGGSSISVFTLFTSGHRRRCLRNSRRAVNVYPGDAGSNAESTMPSRKLE
nr:hypothetical protein [Lacisediminimonas profundi]